MASAPLPANEAQRQAALDSYGVLGTEATEAMDAIVRLASRVCEVPIALVSLVDHGRVWFLAEVGLTDQKEIPREEGFCPYAILEPSLMVVEDATKDARFVDSPFVTGSPGVRFYAGMPLVDGEGFALGALCVSDMVPRALTHAQMESLRDLSLAIVSLLKAHRTAIAAKRAATDLELVLDAVPAMVGGGDREGRTRFANKAFAAHFGKTPADMLGLTLGEFGGPAAYERNRRGVEGALRGEVQTYEHEVTTSTGERRDLETTFVPDWLDGAVRGFVATSTDVTDLKEAIRRAERRNELLQLAEDIAEIGHWRIEYGTDQLYWSPHVYRIHGLDPATFHPTKPRGFELIHPDDRALVGAALQAAEQERAPFELHIRLVRSDGALRRVLLRGRREIDPATGAARALFGVVQDVTDREALRERVDRQERLVTTGTLAAGVGHEINNPLTYIMANIDFAIDELRGSGGTSAARLREVVDVLVEARGGSERIRAIVRGLRALAREETIPVPTNVRATLENAVNVGMHELRHRATLVTDDGDVRPVLADESRLSQLLVNLLVNAAQSFSSVDTAKNRILVSMRNAPGQRVVIEVSDNGCGMSPAVMARVFDPFFTTRPVGQATGLGLSICHNIVTALGGEISCTSGVGVGSTFRVSLPAAPETELAPTTTEATPSTGQRGRILIVDDDQSVLRSLTRLLSGEHEVVSLSDPREALRRLVDESETFDVVFCDVMMPYLSGMDLYRRVRAHDPPLAERFVFISGGGIREEVRAFLADIPNERLEKPFSNQNLRGMARRFVGSAARRSEPTG